MELPGQDYCHETSAASTATLNSSGDVADGEVKYTYRQTNTKFYPDGNLQEFSETKIQKKVAVNEKQKSSNYMPGIIILIIILAFSTLFYTHYSQDYGYAHGAAGQRIRCSFEISEREFPNQNKILWRSLEFGVENVLNDIPTKPSIFLLAYRDAHSANRITRSIVTRTTECMKSKVNALELSPADLASNEMKSDYGVVIAKYQNQLKRSGVMLVNDLNKVEIKTQFCYVIVLIRSFYL